MIGDYPLRLCFHYNIKKTHSLHATRKRLSSSFNLSSFVYALIFMGLLKSRLKGPIIDFAYTNDDKLKEELSRYLVA